MEDARSKPFNPVRGRAYVRLQGYSKSELADMLGYRKVRTLRASLIASEGEEFLKEIGWTDTSKVIDPKGVKRIFESKGWPQEK